MQRFIVMGLPRSGTTYVSSLLNSHPDIASAGELFNPYEVVEFDNDTSDNAVFGRDASPIKAAKSFFERAQQSEAKAAGFKFMIGHNITVLRWIARQPDIKIIFVRRENKLAQASSLVKAVHTQAWVKTAKSAFRERYLKWIPVFVLRMLRQPIPKNRTRANHPDLSKDGRLTLGPRRISQHWHEMATSDFLMNEWLRTTENKVLRLTYRSATDPDTPERLCDFLGVDFNGEMTSPLLKQGSKRIIDRFVYQDSIGSYFKRRDLEKWLGDEFGEVHRQEPDAKGKSAVTPKEKLSED